MFGEIPMNEKYDIFLSMAKLLKHMGFHQKAELLLYEAMSYSRAPHEAHLQLGLLFLVFLKNILIFEFLFPTNEILNFFYQDKEDLERAKLHMKNCIYYNEADIVILIHMAVILLAEVRIKIKYSTIQTSSQFHLTHPSNYLIQGKLHEAKFYVTRILSVLEARVQKFSFLYPKKNDKVPFK